MKSIYIIAVLLFTTAFTGIAQSLEKEETKQIIRGAEDLKSGNYKDVLTSFFQLGVSDISGENRAFEFKSKLFGIKLRADSNLIVDTSFLKQAFARNLQFGFKISTDDNFKPNSIDAGLTYAIVNNRDKALLDLRNSMRGHLVEEYIEALNKLQSEYIAYLNRTGVNDSVIMNEATDLASAMEAFTTNGNTDSFSAEFKKFVADNSGERSGNTETVFAKVLTKEAFDNLNAVIDSAYDDMDKKGLWTVAFNSSTLKEKNIFDNATFETIYLKGMAGDAFEADVRSSLNYKDTISGADDYRMSFGFKAGLNFNLFKVNNGNKHLVEIKPQLEYATILKGAIGDEDKEIFYANAEIRIRITDQLWLPLALKYDVDNQNLFGFLNVSWNLDVFKNFLMK